MTRAASPCARDRHYSHVTETIGKLVFVMNGWIAVSLKFAIAKYRRYGDIARLKESFSSTTQQPVSDVTAITLLASCDDQHLEYAVRRRAQSRA